MIRVSSFFFKEEPIPRTLTLNPLQRPSRQREYGSYDVGEQGDVPLNNGSVYRANRSLFY